MQITCAISGLTFKCENFATISIKYSEGYYHPIFAAPRRTLEYLYAKHTLGELSATDSYLLFLALLHSTESIIWKHPVCLEPKNAVTLIENNIAQLVEVISATRAIVHPSFVQPKFVLRLENSSLDSIPNWIKSWKSNIINWQEEYASMEELESLKVVENKLGALILSGEPAAKYAHVIAAWADKAASFPEHKAEEWKRIIRICFNQDKIFNTSLSEIKQLSEYCAANIEAGSVHFHALASVLRAGVTKHIDYLGMVVPISEYILLPELNAGIEQVEARKTSADSLKGIISRAPDTEPLRESYATLSEYIKAKLAYRVAKQEPLEPL